MSGRKCEKIVALGNFKFWLLSWLRWQNKIKIYSFQWQNGFSNKIKTSVPSIHHGYNKQSCWLKQNVKKLYKSGVLKLPNFSPQKWKCWSFPVISGSSALLENSDLDSFGLPSRWSSKPRKNKKIWQIHVFILSPIIT